MNDTEMLDWLQTQDGWWLYKLDDGAFAFRKRNARAFEGRTIRECIEYARDCINLPDPLSHLPANNTP